MTGLSLARLLGPHGVESFLRESWDRAACLCRQSLGDAVDELLNLSDFERMLATLNRAHDGWLQLARGGRRAVPQSMVDSEGMLDLQQLYAAFAGGETLYLTKAERLKPSIMQLCRRLELDFVELGVGLRRSVNAHVFLTPPDSQGFPPHRDEHASFVVQLDGSKDWTVYDATTERSTGAPRRAGLVDPGSLGAAGVSAHHLEAGDVLYVPEGWAHEARSSSSHSLHLTLRVFSLRWADLLLELGAQHPALAGPIPRHLAARPDALADRCAGLLASDEFRAPLSDLFAPLLRRYAMPKTALPDDGLRQLLDLDRVGLDTPLVHRSGAICQVFETGETVCIAFPGGAIRGPALLRGVFQFIAAQPELRACDLPALAGLEYDRLDIVKTMIREGLLRTASPITNERSGRRS